MKFKDGKKVVLITGGSTGIGRATALAFAKADFKVAIGDISIDEANKTVRMITENGGESMFIKTDVSKHDDVKYMVDQVIKTFGRIDCAFNNAGIEGNQAPTEEGTIENWDRVIDINLKGVWLCMKYEIHEMLKSGGGSIVNMASIAGIVGFSNIAPYTASKHGVNGLTKTAALEYATKHIRVNSVCPGVIYTEMIDRFTGGNEQALQQMAMLAPMERMGTPDEVANAVLWLCSEDASYVTGHQLVIDGGFVAR